MPRIMTVCAKCSDMCFVRFPNGKESNGYVPTGIGLGDDDDYIEFDIDVDTGQIVGWDQTIKNKINNWKS